MMRDVVDGFWSTEEQRDVDVRVLPDGCADIMFDCDRGVAYAIGTMTRPLHITSTTRAFGVRFRSGWAAAILGLPLAPLTDERMEIGSLQTLANSVADAKSDAVRLELLRAWTQRQLARDAYDRRVLRAVDAIESSGGRLSVDDVASVACTTRQHLARLFAYHVGVSPKMFSRVTRFRRALRAGRCATDWADLAATLGYSDQSHFIEEFREFAGATPVPFFLSSAGEGG